MLSLPVIPHSLSPAHSRPLCLACPLLLFLDPQKPLLLHPDNMCCCYKQVVDAYGYGEAVVPLSSVRRTIGGHNPSVRLLLSMALPSLLALSTPLAGVGIPLNQLRSGYTIQPGVTSVWRVDPPIVVLSPAGRSSSSVDGREVLARLPKRSCAGLLFMSCDGVLR